MVSDKIRFYLNSSLVTFLHRDVILFSVLNQIMYFTDIIV